MSMSSAKAAFAAAAIMQVRSTFMAFFVFISVPWYFSAAHRCGVEARLERNRDALSDDLPDAGLGIGGRGHHFPQRVPAEKSGTRAVDAVGRASGKLLGRTLANGRGD